MAQNILNGQIIDELDFPLENIQVQINQSNIITDVNGEFKIELDKDQNIQIKIEHPDFQTFETLISKLDNKKYTFQLNYIVYELDQTILHFHQKEIQNKELISTENLREDYSASIAKTLERTAGIQSMDIGSSTTKPVIRGLGFDRIAVAQNGIKQQGQQWGADHGLEISEWNVDQIEIIKGAGALQYGSDAIGGVISINNKVKPLRNSTNGEFNLLGRTSNESLGAAFKINHRKNDFYYKFSADYTDFADYSVPTQSIFYQNLNIPIYNERMKNTAGNKYSVSAQTGYVSDAFESVLSISNFYQKFGFFPGSHGEAGEGDVSDDGNRRNIDFPYQNVNHFKIENESTLHFDENSLAFLFAYQNNHRQEWNEYHAHHDHEHRFQSEHPHHDHPHDEHDFGDLELDFKLSTFDTQVKYNHKFSKNNQLTTGFQSQFQKNLIDGYGFLIPKFNRQNLGFYAINEIEVSPKLSLNYGLRFDHTQLKIDAFFDDELYHYLLEDHEHEEALSLAQRSQDLNKNINNLNYSLGILYQAYRNWDFNLNLSSNFRIPTAIELASNGVHHGSFRHEKGNPNLDAEKGWSADFKIGFHNNGWDIVLNPYLYYFKNYIYLNPTDTPSPLPDAENIYQFDQAKAIITGVDLSIEKKFSDRLKTYLSFEYQYNELEHEDGSFSPLPLSPPATLFNEWTVRLIENKGIFESLDLSGNVKFGAKQSRIAKDEKVTDAYHIFGASLKSKFAIHSFRFNVYLNAQNLANKKYYNHMSFYRALEIPEMGRNIQLVLNFPF